LLVIRVFFILACSERAETGKMIRDTATMISAVSLCIALIRIANFVREGKENQGDKKAQFY